MLQDFLTNAALLAPAVVAVVGVAKSFLPAGLSAERRDSTVRILTVAVGMALELLVYCFTADHVSRQAIGQCLAEGCSAAALAVGSYHGVTFAVAALPTRMQAPAATPVPVAPLAVVPVSAIELVAQDGPAFPPAS